MVWAAPTRPLFRPSTPPIFFGANVSTAPSPFPFGISRPGPAGQQASEQGKAVMLEMEASVRALSDQLGQSARHVRQLVDQFRS